MSEFTTWVAVRLQNSVAQLRERQEGQTLVEYGLIIAFIGILLILALIFLKDKIASLFSKTGSTLAS